MTFTITNNADNSEQIIEEIEIPGPIRFPVVFDYPYVFQWSKDSRSFYFSHLSSFVDGCFAVSRPGGAGLKRYDLSSSSIITIHEDHAEWMALSPNEKQLAYIGAYSGIIFVMDMESNSTQPFVPTAIDNSNISYYADFIYWSPDGKSLVYSYFADPCNPEMYPPDRYLVQLFPNLNQLKILLSPNEHDYIPSGWDIQDKIVLEDNNNNLWWLNPNTKEITPAQP